MGCVLWSAFDCLSYFSPRVPCSELGRQTGERCRRRPCCAGLVGFLRKFWAKQWEFLMLHWGSLRASKLGSSFFLMKNWSGHFQAFRGVQCTSLPGPNKGWASWCSCPGEQQRAGLLTFQWRQFGLPHSNVVCWMQTMFGVSVRIIMMNG